MFREQVKLTDQFKVRMFYRGREILDQFYLGNYGIKDNDVVQAMIVS